MKTIVTLSGLYLRHRPSRLRDEPLIESRAAMSATRSECLKSLLSPVLKCIIVSQVSHIRRATRKQALKHRSSAVVGSGHEFVVERMYVL